MINIRKVRKKLGLSAERFGKLIGSNTCSVYNWENGRSSPRYKYLWDRIYKLCELFQKIEDDPDYLVKKE